MEYQQGNVHLTMCVVPLSHTEIKVIELSLSFSSAGQSFSYFTLTASFRVVMKMRTMQHDRVAFLSHPPAYWIYWIYCIYCIYADIHIGYLGP